MTTRTRTAAILLAAGVALAALLAFAVDHERAKSQPARAIDAIPADAQVVITAHLEAVRSSPYRELFGSDAVPSLVPGGGSACGKGAVARMREVAIWVPQQSGDDFGLAANGDASSDAIWSCAQDTITRRGGRPTRTVSEGFSLILDESLGPGAAQIAVRDPGLVLLGRPMTRARMMDALGGRTPAASSTGEHARMRAELTDQGELTISVLVGAGLQARIADMAGEPTPTFDAVQAIAATFHLAAQSRVQILLWCSRSDAAERVATWLNRRRDAITRSLPLRASGIAAWFDDARIDVQGTRVSLATTAQASQVLDVLRRLERLDDLLDPPPSGESPPAMPSAGVGETLRPAPVASDAKGGRGDRSAPATSGSAGAP